MLPARSSPTGPLPPPPPRRKRLPACQSPGKAASRPRAPWGEGWGPAGSLLPRGEDGRSARSLPVLSPAPRKAPAAAPTILRPLTLWKHTGLNAVPRPGHAAPTARPEPGEMAHGVGDAGYARGVLLFKLNHCCWPQLGLRLQAQPGGSGPEDIPGQSWGSHTTA